MGAGPVVGAVGLNQKYGTLVMVNGGWQSWYEKQQFYRSTDHGLPVTLSRAVQTTRVPRVQKRRLPGTLGPRRESRRRSAQQAHRSSTAQAPPTRAAVMGEFRGRDARL